MTWLTSIPVPPPVAATSLPSFLPAAPPPTRLYYYTRCDERSRTVPIAGVSFWGPGGNPDPNYTPVLRTAAIAHVLVWVGVSRPPWRSLRAALNRVNPAVFLDVAPEHLLFSSLRAQPDGFVDPPAIAPGLVDDQPALWTLEFVFTECPDAWIGDVGGWNVGYTGTQQGFAVTLDAGGNRFYPLADFSPLFAEAPA